MYTLSRHYSVDFKLSRSDDELFPLKVVFGYKDDAVGSHFGHTLDHSMRMPSKAR